MTITIPDRPTTAASGTERLLDFSGVAMRFPNGTVALSGVDLSVKRGELVSVVGPSGCGKSTLLRIASGLETITDGALEVRTDRIGYVFQDATLLPWRNVQANVELLAELHKEPKATRTAKAKQAIDLVGLSGFEKHLPKQLSGGMRMRTSLARSLTLDPELFLFDELLRIFTEQRFAGLFITHSVAEAVYLSTRVVVMSGRPGRIVDTFEVPFDYPRDPDLRFTPEFAALSGQVSHALREGHS